MELLHDYQGIRHRFKDDDLDPKLLERGQAIIIEILKLPSLIDVSLIRYDLSFYSGGIGIIDKLFIKLSCNNIKASEIISSLKLVDVATDNLDLDLRDILTLPAKAIGGIRRLMGVSSDKIVTITRAELT